MNIFQAETPKLLAQWNGAIVSRVEPYDIDMMVLLAPIPCGDHWIPALYKWNGASVGPLRWLFPKWKHPVATCRHDYRCQKAKYWYQRKIADVLFYRDVGVRGTKYEQIIGYTGVRLGALWALATGKLTL